MSPETSPAVQPEPSGMSEFGRLTGVFFEPGKTFTDIAQRPRWFVALLLVVLANIAFALAFGQRVGWDGFMQDQIDNNATLQQQMERLSPEQRAQSIAIQTKVMSISYTAGPVLGIPLAYLLYAALILGLASGMMSAGLKFKQVFAICSYAGLTAVISKILAIVVLFLKNPDEFNMMNPLAFNPGAFMDPKETSKFVYTLATGLDLFAIWTLVLTAIGLKMAAGKRLSSSGAFFAATLPWAVFLLFGASIAGLFS